MLLSAVLFVLFLAGCWLYCLTDAALTPAAEFRGLRRNAWIYIIAATFVVGAIAWLIARRSWRTRSSVTTAQAARGPLASPANADFTWDSPWSAADAAVARHPAARSRRLARHREHVPQGPDDDPEFLRQLDRRIRGTSADSGELPAPTSQPTRQGRGLAPSQPRRISTAASTPPVRPSSTSFRPHTRTPLIAPVVTQTSGHSSRAPRIIVRDPYRIPASNPAR